MERPTAGNGNGFQPRQVSVPEEVYKEFRPMIEALVLKVFIVMHKEFLQHLGSHKIRLTPQGEADSMRRLHDDFVEEYEVMTRAIQANLRKKFPEVVVGPPLSAT